jgi:hypothetical protein
MCQAAEGPTGKGHAVLTFAPDGTVSDVEIDAPFQGTSVGNCVVDELKQAWIDPFSGAPITVGKSFDIPRM